MSLARRLLFVVRANLNALLEPPDSETTVDPSLDGEHGEGFQQRRRQRQQEDSLRAEQLNQERAQRWTDEYEQTDPDGVATILHREQARLAPFYEVLDVPPGSDLGTVRRSFHRLMRLHHPDLHPGDPEKGQGQAQTERVQQITEAYAELARALAET